MNNTEPKVPTSLKELVESQQPKGTSQNQDEPTLTQPTQPTESQQLEMGIRGMEIMLNAFASALQNTQEGTMERAMVLQNFAELQKKYFQTRVMIAGYKILEHFNHDLETTLRTLDQLVMQATSNVELVSADGFDRKGRKVI